MDLLAILYGVLCLANVFVLSDGRVEGGLYHRLSVPSACFYVYVYDYLWCSVLTVCSGFCCRAERARLLPPAGEEDLPLPM